jgi:hypothetical protein
VRVGSGGVEVLLAHGTDCSDDVGAARGFVVYAGEERYGVGEGVEAIGLVELAKLVAGR